jgi:hypothetical protein
MALTKTTYSMISNSVANVMDNIPQSEQAAIRSQSSTFDCSSAFQMAIDSNRDIYIPMGRYRINTPLNMTNKAAGFLKMFGEGWGQSNSGSVLEGNTGGIVIDCTGSQFLSFEDFSIDSNYSSPPNPSTIGILFARSTVSQFSQFNTLRNIYIDLASVPLSNNGFGTVGLYNCAAEMSNYDNIWFKGDTAIALNPYNVNWAVTSPYTTISTIFPSMSMVKIGGISSLTSKSASRNCAYVANAFEITFENTYFSGIPGSAMYLEGCNNLKVDGHFESGNASVIAEMVACEMCDIRWTGGPTTISPISLGNSVTFANTISLTCNRVESGWPFIIQGQPPSTLGNIKVNLVGDNGTKPLTNISNVAGSQRSITRSATNGGFAFQNVPDYLSFVSYSGVPANNSLFINPATGKISFVDNSGVTHALY